MTCSDCWHCDWNQQHGDLGLSSLAMLQAARTSGEPTAYAMDASDLGRCERLYTRALLHRPQLAALMLPHLEENRRRVATRQPAVPA